MLDPVCRDKDTPGTPGLDTLPSKFYNANGVDMLKRKSKGESVVVMEGDEKLWEITNNDTSANSRTKGTTDGVARENGDQVYRQDITNKICPDMYKSLPRCNLCRQNGSTLDLRDIPPNSYHPGEYIIGDLDEYGWK